MSNTDDAEESGTNGHPNVQQRVELDTATAQNLTRNFVNSFSANTRTSVHRNAGKTALATGSNGARTMTPTHSTSTGVTSGSTSTASTAPMPTPRLAAD